MNDLISRQDAIDAVDKCDAIYIFNEPVMAYKIDIRQALLELPSAQPDIIHCRDCKHKPYPFDNYDYNSADCGFEIIFPDYRCPCRCDDEYYNYIPDDDWFCGNAERRTDE